MSTPSTPQPLDLTIAVLTWNAPNTLRNTLGSYQASGLLRHAKEAVIYLQEDNPKERRIAEEFGFKILASKENIGIQAGIEALLKVSATEYFLFLENDWVCVESPQAVTARLHEATALLDNNTAKCVRLRHKYQYGDPLHTLQFKGREMEKTTHLLDCVHWIENPEQTFPDVLYSVYMEKEKWILTDSRYANYTNNPCLYRTAFFKDALSKYVNLGVSTGGDASQHTYAQTKGVSPHAIALEGNIQTWWQEQRLAVAQGVGLFRHDPQPEVKSFYSAIKHAAKKILRGSPRRLRPNTVPQIAFICAHRETDTLTVPLSLALEFERRGWEARFFTLFDEHDAYHDRNIRLLNTMMCNNWYRPDIIFHLDYTGFRSRFFSKINQPDIFTVFESSDDPKRFETNYPKTKNFDLILSPDYLCTEKYRGKGVHALWWTHFADDTVCKQFDVPQTHAAVCTLGRGSSPLMDRLEDERPDIFTNCTGIYGEEHSRFLCSGKIVLQHSRDKEITRRLFEAMACGRMVLTDRLPPETHVDALFTEGKDIVYYDDFDDCVKKIEYYTAEQHAAEREAIAANGYANVLQHHTQRQRVDVILEEFVTYCKFSS